MPPTAAAIIRETCQSQSPCAQARTACQPEYGGTGVLLSASLSDTVTRTCILPVSRRAAAAHSGSESLGPGRATQPGLGELESGRLGIPHWHPYVKILSRGQPVARGGAWTRAQGHTRRARICNIVTL